MNNKKRAKFYVMYTAVFAATAMLVFSFFFDYAKSFVWATDGLYQHYNAFIYLGTWFREIFKTLIFEHRLVIPMWEFGIGYGADVFATLSYYVYGDPFALVSVVTPARYAEIGYAVSILLRFYVSGIAFCAYANKMNCQRFAALCASMIYVFCSYSLFAGVRHPYFTNPMIYLPLILLGVEKILLKEKPFIYVLAVFVAALSNFYFFYMIVLFTVIYVTIRTLSYKDNRHLKKIIGYVFQFGGYALIGIAMASVLFLPDVMNFQTNSRISDAYTVNTFYYINQYELLAGSFVGVYAAVDWAYTGMAPLAWLGVGAILLQKKELRWAKIFFGILILFLLFPIAGYVFNGLGYVANRWVFAWALLVAFLFARGYPLLLHMERRKKAILSAGCGVYSLLCLILEKSRMEEVLAGCVLLLICLLAVWGSDLAKHIEYHQIQISKKRICQALTLTLAIMCIYENAYYRYSLTERDYLNEFRDNGVSYKLLTQERADAWESIRDDEFYRIDHATNDNSQANFALSSGQSTTTAYWSLTNPNLVEFLQYNSAYERGTYGFRGLCSRSLLLPLASAKYFVTSSNKVAQLSIPYSFSQEATATDSTAYTLYQTDYTLPLGYTYDSIIPLEQYESMTIAQRQQATLQGAVIASKDITFSEFLSYREPQYSDVSLDYKITCDKNTKLHGELLTVKAKNATITLTFDCPANAELYVQILGLHFESKSGYHFWSEKTWAGKTDYVKAVAKHSLKYWKPSTLTTITASCGSASAAANHYTSQDRHAAGREDYFFNLYYSDKPRTSISIKFSEKGVYKLGNLSVVCQPMDGFEQRIASLREDVLEKVELDRNYISGTIQLRQPKLLCLSIPYSNGWSVYVNGKKAEAIKTNIMYLGVMIGAGEHTIELVYRTPFLMAGACGSILGFLGLVAAMMFYNKGQANKDISKKRRKNLAS